MPPGHASADPFFEGTFGTRPPPLKMHAFGVFELLDHAQRSYIFGIFFPEGWRAFMLEYEALPGSTTVVASHTSGAVRPHDFVIVKFVLFADVGLET